MNIGIYDPYLDTMGGGEKYMLTAAVCLLQNHNITIFWDPKDKTAISNLAYKRFGLDISRIEFTKNVFSKDVSSVYRIWQLKNYEKIFYLSDGGIPFILGKKLVIHFQFPVPWLKKSLLNSFKLLFVKDIICNSLFTKKSIDKTFSLNSKVIYPSPNDYQIKKVQKNNIILTVGRFNRLPDGSNFKKLDVMIDVFKKMVNNGLKNWKLVVVVSFKEEDKEYIKKLDELSKDCPIIVKKNIYFDELNKLYGCSKIYWHAAGFAEDLEIHPQRAEHFGIATVEAMRQGAVPIVINAGGQPEIVKENVNGFLWITKEELIDKTLAIINNSKLLKTISDRARQIDTLFSKERFCKEVSLIFK